MPQYMLSKSKWLKLCTHIINSMKQQLKMLRKTIELAEKDITANYTEEEIRYMKKKYRELREEIRYAQRLQNNGFMVD